MKKLTLSLFASICALGVLADTIVDYDTNTNGVTYTYENNEGAVTLTEIDPRLEGPEFDLSAIQKLFSMNDLRIVALEQDLDCYLDDPSAVTSVVLSEHLNADAVSTLHDNLKNLESFYGGGGEIMSVDGIAYTDGGRLLLACPRARAGSVTIPGGCCEIDTSAFWGCTGIKGVSGGATPLRVRELAFGGLNDDNVPGFIADSPDGIVVVNGVVLGWKGQNVPAEITLPGNATSVASYAFTKAVTNVNGGANVKWVGEEAFPGVIDASPEGEPVMVGKVLIGCNGEVSSLTVPEDAVTIAPSAFFYKLGLSELIFPDNCSLELIDHHAFGYCTSLTNVALPDCVGEIGRKAFYGCINLAEVTFGKSTETLGESLFSDCDNLLTVNFRGDSMPPVYDAENLYKGTPDGLATHIMKDAAGWPEDMTWCGRDLVRDLMRDPVTAKVGYYGKWKLDELGVTLPPAGVVFAAVAYGLPDGLVLKCNKAKKNRKGKIITKAKTTWWIEGVPTATLDHLAQTAFVKITVNGYATLYPLALSVVEDAVTDYDFKLNETVAKPIGWLGIGGGWTLSGLPKGLKQTRRAGKFKVAGKVLRATAYGIYGKPTVPGNYIVTAKKKSGTWTLVRKLRFRVLNADGTPVDDPVAPTAVVPLGFNNEDGRDGTVVFNSQGGVSNYIYYAFTTSPDATITLSGAPSTVYLVEDEPGKWRLAGHAPPGDYHLTVTATQDGFLTARQSLLVHLGTLPAWAVGSFTGYVTAPEDVSSPLGYCTASVTAKGAISGKLAMNGTNYVFSKTFYDSFSSPNGVQALSADGIALQTYKTMSVYDKKKKKTVRKQVLVDSGMTIDIAVASGVSGVLSGEVSDSESTLATVHAQQNLWKTSYKDIGTALFRTSAKKQYKTFKLTSGYGLADGASLTFKVTSLGVVTVTGAFPYGKRVKRKGRWVIVTAYAKPVASTVLLPDTGPEAGAAGFKGRVAVCLGSYFSGIVDIPFLAEGSSWSAGEFNGVAYTRLPNFSYVNGLTNEEFTLTYGTYNIKVKESLAFTGTFTPVIGDPVTFAGTFVRKDDPVAVGAYHYEASSTLTWNGWTIPFKLMLASHQFNAISGEAGSITFNGTSASGAEFSTWETSSGQAFFNIPSVNQDLFLRSDVGLAVKQSTEAIAADLTYCQLGNDSLYYNFSSNGRVSITGTALGYEVKVSSVLQLFDGDQTGGPFQGYFVINLEGIGLFLQECVVNDEGKVSVENYPLMALWSLDTE